MPYYLLQIRKKLQPVEKDGEMLSDAQLTPLVFSITHTAGQMMLWETDFSGYSCVCYSPGKGTSELEHRLPDLILVIFNISRSSSAVLFFFNDKLWLL